ncbi:MAG: DUF2779 domain-containing protein [Erysipelotrichaceae bacterium]|nr:DUF2779 domain-containing protein [Erysipelotrichaceae bacterium]
MIHISDIKKFLRCERLYCYSRNEETAYNAYLRNDDSIIDLVKEFFGIEECFLGIRNDPESRFLEAKDQYEWFLRPRLEDGELRVTIPVVHRTDDHYDLCFIYYNTQIRELDLLTWRITCQVFRKKGLSIGKVSILRFNRDYVFHEKLEPRKLLVEETVLKGKEILALIDEETVDIEQILKRMEKATGEDLPATRKRSCKNRERCLHYYDCFPEEAALPDDSILTLVSSAKKQKMYDQGITLLKDADPALLEGNKLQYAQIMSSRNEGVFTDTLNLRMWLKKLEKRPLSFIDFEWDRYLVPAYEGMRPLDVVCFEFALYILDKDASLNKITFIGTKDCRREFAEGLLRYLPKEGPIVAYNAIGAEILRLEELAALYPDLSEELQKIIDRFEDLSVPFTEGMVYDRRMRGDLSLKKLVSIVSDLSYHDLDIGNGMQAVYSWRDIDKGLSENSEEVLSNLEEYCSLDAYGLYLVYCWLLELVRR